MRQISDLCSASRAWKAALSHLSRELLLNSDGPARPGPRPLRRCLDTAIINGRPASRHYWNEKGEQVQIRICSRSGSRSVRHPDLYITWIRPEVLDGVLRAELDGSLLGCGGGCPLPAAGGGCCRNPLQAAGNLLDPEGGLERPLDRLAGGPIEERRGLMARGRSGRGVA